MSNAQFTLTYLLYYPCCFFLSFPTHPLCILPHLSQWPAHPSVDQTLRLFCLFCHIICLWFGAKNPIILSAFPVMPPPVFTPSLIRSNPPDYTVSLCHIIYLQSKTANHNTPPLFTLPCRSSLGDHLIPHLLTRSIHHRRVSEAPPFKNRRTSLASANVCNALYGERWWDAVERWMT